MLKFCPPGFNTKYIIIVYSGNIINVFPIASLTIKVFS